MAFKSSALFNAAKGRMDDDEFGSLQVQGEAKSKANLTAEDIFEAARYLGIDPVGEPRFLWIAEEMLTSALPKGYTEHTDDEGNIYFFNSETQESSWQHPLFEMCSNLYNKLKEEGGDSQLAAASEFFNSKLKRRVFIAWNQFRKYRKQKYRKGMLVMRYWESNVLALNFEKWKDFVLTKQMNRRKMRLVKTYFTHRTLAKFWRSWLQHREDEKLNRKKRLRAKQYFSASATMKSMARWKVSTFYKYNSNIYIMCIVL